jgi:hypothetical protein
VPAERQRLKKFLEIEFGSTNNLREFTGCGLLLSRLGQLVGKVAYLLLQVGNGCGCGRYFASLGPIRALFRSPRVGHDEPQSYANLGFRAMAGSPIRVKTGKALCPKANARRL